MNASTRRIGAPLFGASRAAMLEWVRTHAPDLRIARHVTEDGQRACSACFTYRGQVFEYETTKAPAEDVIVQACFESLRYAMGLPSAGDVERRREIEQQIVEASRTGQTAAVEQLTQQLVTENEARPRTRARWRIGDTEREKAKSPQVVSVRTT